MPMLSMSIGSINNDYLLNHDDLVSQLAMTIKGNNDNNNNNNDMTRNKLTSKRAIPEHGHCHLTGPGSKFTLTWLVGAICKQTLVRCTEKRCVLHHQFNNWRLHSSSSLSLPSISLQRPRGYIYKRERVRVRRAGVFI